MDGMVSLDGILIQTSQTLTDLSFLTPRQRQWYRFWIWCHTSKINCKFYRNILIHFIGLLSRLNFVKYWVKSKLHYWLANKCWPVSLQVNKISIWIIMNSRLQLHSGSKVYNNKIYPLAFIAGNHCSSSAHLQLDFRINEVTKHPQVLGLSRGCNDEINGFWNLNICQFGLSSKLMFI